MDNYSGKIEKLNIWEKVKIKEVCSHIFSGGTPNTNKREYWGGPIPWLSSGETRSRFIKETKNSITELGVQNSSTRLARAGSSVIASAGQGHTRGQVSYLLIDTYINQSVIALFPMEDKLDSKFLFYALAMKYERLRQISDDHSIRGSLTTKILGEEYIQLPSIQEQKAIAKILSDLDSKIELTEKMNKTLEGIAQAIFKHWFIDFEFPNEEGKPYKSSGGEMVDSELGMIPSNWTIKKLDDIANFLNGLPLQKYPAISGERYFPVIKIKEMNSGISTSSDKASCDIPPEYIVANGDILFAWSGSLGVTIWCNGMGALHQHVFKVSSTEYPKWFYYQWLLHYLPDFIEIAKYKATTMGHIQRQHLSKSLVAVPDSNTFKMMNTIFNPIINRIINLRVEKDVLAKTRDIILPKLMTGKIRVSLEDKNDKQNE